MPSRLFRNPLPPALGDPFVLRWSGRFYLYGTNDGPPLPDGLQVPVFRSGDMIHWEPLGGALVPSDPTADHWAPEVLPWNGRFYMIVSFGDVDRAGHALWVAVADRPEGPFRLETRISDPSERFSIDGSWLLDDDGSLYLYRCRDFVDEAPFGTGIVVQRMRDPLTPDGPARTVLRAHAPWHLFEANRRMPLYEGREFAEWTTIEGPAPVKRYGRYYCGYSGGNFTGAYGTGEAVADHPLGPYADLRGREGPIFATTPGLVEGPGHFSVVQPDGLRDWIALHGRTPGEGARRVWLCPAEWGRDGVTIGELTDREQPAPPLPTWTARFDDPAGPVPEGWTAEGGSWRLDGSGLVQEDPGPEGEGEDDDAMLWRDDFALAGDWLVEVVLRCPGGVGLPGLTVGRFAASVLIDGPNRRVRIHAVGEPVREFPLPRIGEGPFALDRSHALSVRCLGGRGEVRVDGALVASGVTMPPGGGRLGLTGCVAAAFESISVTIG